MAELFLHDSPYLMEKVDNIFAKSSIITSNPLIILQNLANLPEALERYQFIHRWMRRRLRYTLPFVLSCSIGATYFRYLKMCLSPEETFFEFDPRGFVVSERKDNLPPVLEAYWYALAGDIEKALDLVFFGEDFQVHNITNLLHGINIMDLFTPQEIGDYLNDFHVKCKMAKNLMIHKVDHNYAAYFINMVNDRFVVKCIIPEEIQKSHIELAAKFLTPFCKYYAMVAPFSKKSEGILWLNNSNMLLENASYLLTALNTCSSMIKNMLKRIIEEGEQYPNPIYGLITSFMNKNGLPIFGFGPSLWIWLITWFEQNIREKSREIGFRSSKWIEKRIISLIEKEEKENRSC